VLVEGGGQIHTDFLENRLADKMLVSLAPKLIGGLQAPGYFQGEGISDLQKALQLKKTRFFRIENDILVEGYF
jgi:diaminohydroxyphosphoribosylaminopyrimidine deaminase/5-amino-6-(5-phosphoribosylamino)uracil reductase